MGKLTKDQFRALEAVAAGAVSLQFDVHCGYRWLRRDHRTRWRTSEADAPAVLRHLIVGGLIDLGPTDRPYSGHRVNKYALTDLGRATLEKDRPNGE